MTIAASVLNGAWASTSISLATTLIAAFGPRTPVVAATVANGLVEAGGPLLCQVRSNSEDAVLALSVDRLQKKVRDLVDPGWNHLQSADEFGHTGLLRIDAYPAVRKVLVNNAQMEGVPLLSVDDPVFEHRSTETAPIVELESDGETLGFVHLDDYLRMPFGEDIYGIRILFTDFTMQKLGNFVCSACSAPSQRDFPSVPSVYWKFVRRIMEPVPAPDHKRLGLQLGQIGLDAQINADLNGYERSLLKIEEITAGLPQPHCNIMRVLLTAKFSHLYQVHYEAVINEIICTVADIVRRSCKAETAGENRMVEIYVLFGGIDDDISENDEIIAVISDTEKRKVLWLSRSDRSILADLLSKSSFLVFLVDGFAGVNMSSHTYVVRLKHSSHGKLEMDETTVAVVREEHSRAPTANLSAEEWNASRMANTVRTWPYNWEPEEPASMIETVKGLAEIASLQAIMSEIAAGSVLFGKLLGA